MNAYYVTGQDAETGVRYVAPAAGPADACARAREYAADGDRGVRAWREVNGRPWDITPAAVRSWDGVNAVDVACLNIGEEVGTRHDGRRLPGGAGLSRSR